MTVSLPEIVTQKRVIDMFKDPNLLGYEYLGDWENRDNNSNIEKEYLENKFPFKNVDALYFNKWSTVVKKRYQVKAMEFTKTKDLLPYVDDMFDLLKSPMEN